MSMTAIKFEKGMHRRRWRLYVSHAYSTNEAFSNRISVRRGSRHSLRGDFQENMTHKNKKGKKTNKKKPGQIERWRLFQHHVTTHMVLVQQVSLGKGRKGRRHDLCVIVSPYIHKHIFNRIVFDFSKCVHDGRGGGDGVLLGSIGVILDNINRKMLFQKS